MKKLFAIAILGSVVLVSCKKSSSGGSAPMQATINGTVTNFSTATGLTQSPGAGSVGYAITVDGIIGGSSSANVLGITLTSPNPIVAGTYTDTVYNSTTPFGGIDYQLGGSDLSSIVGQKSHLTTVVVTSISSTQIVGTFQGTIYAGMDSTSTPMTITNGTFTAKLVAE